MVVAAVRGLIGRLFASDAPIYLQALPHPDRAGEPPPVRVLDAMWHDGDGDGIPRRRVLERHVRAAPALQLVDSRASQTRKRADAHYCTPVDEFGLRPPH